MIGILVPGTPLMTGGPITSSMVVLDIFNPKNINNISIFLHETLPNDFGAGLYFSLPPYETLQFIGCVGNQRPSDIFYTGWAMNQYVNSFDQIKLCVKLDKLDDLKNCHEAKIKNDINQVFMNDNIKEYSKKIAKNLFNYLDSFNQNQDSSKKLLVVPLNSLETWYERFQQKYALDPNFIMKTD